MSNALLKSDYCNVSVLYIFAVVKWTFCLCVLNVIQIRQKSFSMGRNGIKLNFISKKRVREKTTAGTARGTVKRSAELILQLVRTMQGLNTVINNEYDVTEFSIFSNEDI